MLVTETHLFTSWLDGKKNPIYVSWVRKIQSKEDVCGSIVWWCWSCKNKIIFCFRNTLFWKERPYFKANLVQQPVLFPQLNYKLLIYQFLLCMCVFSATHWLRKANRYLMTMRVLLGRDWRTFLTWTARSWRLSIAGTNHSHDRRLLTHSSP